MLMMLAAFVQTATGATPNDVVVPNAIVGLHNQYVRCQDEHFDPQRIRDRTSFGSEVERAIAACAGRKAELKQQADAVLVRAPGYADAAVRQRALHEAFDGYDRTRRLMAQASETPGVAQPTERRAVPEASLTIPDELVPAVIPYAGCLLARDGTEVRGSFDPRPRDVQRGGDCTGYREQAVARAEAILQRIGGRSADERRAYIQQTLTAIENFQAASTAPSRQGQSH